MSNKTKKRELIIEPSPDNSSDESDGSDVSEDYENLEEEYKELNCDDENYYSKDCNKFLLKKELLERNHLLENEDKNANLYPELNDKNFNIKIAVKKEFNDTKYDGKIYEDIKKQSDILANADFELQPHQAFVKNFLSFQTPYNSLLLFHGLGTGKTCSAIGVCEEMRDYMKQMGVNKRIIVVASENVQDNFKLQLFDERKLKLVDGLWNIRACTGNKLLKEINPMNMKGISREKVISQIKNLINAYYLFLGYGQFANYIIKTMHYNEELIQQKEMLLEKKQKKQKNKSEGKKLIQKLKEVKLTLNKRIIKRLRNEFDNRFIVIDEIHNIRKSEDNENKKVAENLEILVKSVFDMRLLLLSATPMYNSYKEIVWLLNLMNMNDRRGKIEVKDIFDSEGNFKKGGEELLIRKATGYVSFVRGENPYTFPYRVYPNIFSKENTFPHISYPTHQMNLNKIKHEDKNRILSLYLTKIGNCGICGKCQYCVYKYIIHNLRIKNFSNTTKRGIVRQMPSFENMESFGYTLLQMPLESLIISYPINGLKEAILEFPEEKYSPVLSKSFSEIKENEEENVAVNESDNEDENVSVNEEDNEEDNEEMRDEFKDDENIQFSVSKSKKLNDDTTETAPLSGGAKIDQKILTGRLGLERMMNYVDETSPPIKGNFEYKKTTVDNYGKIFSYENIGNFSSKIKCILNNIYNFETERVSDGIILIYSQYIDSGLIPMALALEEMGFVRYGEGAKQLFKNKPTEVVDVRTMKPPVDRNNFLPARYSMITGDSRLSPNNDFEVKGLTNENNSDGNKVKVVLISKAGAEGIDFKFIRQVHILEPWYNMNRIEQIIGRGVRNFSHKDLDFEKRNVQIFMYGTILGDENIEEAVDLYVYRVAEYKAIQIGKVTRVLKETAVDCIINHDQTNFTQEIMSASLKTKIKQELSTGIVIKDFKIGDAPFSPACDYMAKCDFNCNPNKKINEKQLNEDTYGESFITINSEKILQTIRMLMKESFFYKKNELISKIQHQKKYPYIQIYSSLTQLIEDDNEFITDRYGRNGRLVNIGEYYFFQPLEIKDTNISIYDRSVPIDYKHNMIKFEIKQDIAKQVIDKRDVKKIERLNKKEEEDEEEEEDDEIHEKEGKRILDEFKANFDLSREFSKNKTVPRGDDNWYKHCGVVMKKMSLDYPEIKQYFLEFLVAHQIELLLFDEKVHLMNYVYSLDNLEKNTFEFVAKEYFDRNTITTKDLNGYVMHNLNKTIIMILNEDNKWVIAEHEDQRTLGMSKEANRFLSFNSKEYNRLVGFIGYEKHNKYLVFKTKDMESSRDTGARCDEAGKEKTIKKINEILGENKFSNENTKLKKNANGTVISQPVSHTELCVFKEFILRYFDIIKKDGKKWFLTPELALYHKLYKVFV